MRELGEDKVIAILCSDIHLSSKPPRVRREEKDWFAAMKKPLDQLTEIADFYKAPILCAGDVFDYWKADPALINFALQHLPTMYAVPGQHDLPLHNIDLIEKSAFWTMVLADRISPVLNFLPIENNIVVHGFPWGVPLKPLNKKNTSKERTDIALIHEYLWIKKYKHPQAPKNNHISKFKSKAIGYDALVFGDNHKGFKTKLNGIPVMNCGSFMRRKADELRYIPRVGLLCKSGIILTHYLSTKLEQFISVEDDFEGKCRGNESDMIDFIHGLKDVQAQCFDYAEAIEFLMKKRYTKNTVRKLLLEALKRD